MASTPPLLKCPTCEGHRRVIEIKETTMYACGFVQQAVTCPDCKGAGVIAKKPAGRVRRFLARVGVRA